MSALDQVYENRNTIRNKRELLLQLGYKKSEVESKADELSKLAIYATARGLEDLIKLREVVEKELSTLTKVRAALINNYGVATADDLTAKLKELPSSKAIETDIVPKPQVIRVR